MIHQHGRMHRSISAYELVEGNDDMLFGVCTFCAHMLVNLVCLRRLPQCMSQRGRRRNAQQLRCAATAGARSLRVPQQREHAAVQRNQRAKVLL